LVQARRHGHPKLAAGTRKNLNSEPTERRPQRARRCKQQLDLLVPERVLASRSRHPAADRPLETGIILHFVEQTKRERVRE